MTIRKIYWMNYYRGDLFVSKNNRWIVLYWIVITMTGGWLIDHENFNYKVRRFVRLFIVFKNERLKIYFYFTRIILVRNCLHLLPISFYFTCAANFAFCWPHENLWVWISWHTFLIIFWNRNVNYNSLGWVEAAATCWKHEIKMWIKCLILMHRQFYFKNIKIYICHALHSLLFVLIFKKFSRGNKHCSSAVKSLILLLAINFHSHFTRLLSLGDNFL